LPRAAWLRFDAGGSGGQQLHIQRIIALCAVLCCCASSGAHAREFGGYDCTDDCSGRAAGYRWAEAHGVTSDSDCPLRGGAISFYEGCLVYVEDPDRGADEDDDGDDIDH
jgi:hypothetical protein